MRWPQNERDKPKPIIYYSFLYGGYDEWSGSAVRRRRRTNRKCSCRYRDTFLPNAFHSDRIPLNKQQQHLVTIVRTAPTENWDRKDVRAGPPKEKSGPAPNRPLILSSGFPFSSRCCVLLPFLRYTRMNSGPPYMRTHTSI